MMKLVNATREERRRLAIANATYPEHLVSIPRSDWPSTAQCLTLVPIEVWRSRHFLVQIFAGSQAERLTICRTKVTGNNWQDGITWDDLQRLKKECGRGDKWAVEIFPAEGETVNVANMRHIWVLERRPSYAWHKGMYDLEAP